jgi:hypothetical protein
MSWCCFYFLFASFPVISQALHCIRNEHTVGKWVYNDSPDLRKSFVCCSLENWGFQNESYCGSKSRSNYWGSNEFVSYQPAHACSCDTVSKTVFTVSNRERYYWQPDECQLPEWNAKEFCKLLNNRTYLSVGDSTFRQSSMTLASMITVGQGGCADRIFANNSIDMTNTYPDWRGSTIVSALDTMQKTYSILPDIVVIGAGAWIHSIEVYEKNWVSIKEQLQLLHRRYPKMKFIWKTQNPGHPKCTQFSTPVNKEIRIPSNDKYGWSLHREFDRMSIENVKSLISWENDDSNHSRNSTGHKQQHIPFIQVLDMTPLLLRPDGHRDSSDCLHYCVPGPLDLFSILMYNLLITNQI